MKVRNRRSVESYQWANADEDSVHDAVFRWVPELEQKQSSMYARFARLEAMYDPNNDAVIEQLAFQRTGVINENVVASNVDTVKAVIAETEVSPRVETDGADWGQQRRARHLEWYSEGLLAAFDVHPKCRKGFKESAKKGTGFAKVSLNRADRIIVEHVMPDDVVVPDMECRFDEEPRELHHRRMNVSKEALKVEYPEYAEEIDRAGTMRGSTAVSRRVQYNSARPDYLVVIESWYRPIGTKGTKYYKAGRYTKCIDGCDLEDEEWHGMGDGMPTFPVVRLLWESRAGSYFGISGAERIEGHQKALDKLNWQEERQHDQMAVPTTYVRPADANLAVKTTSRLGTVSVYTAELPKTVIPPAISPETTARHERTLNSAFAEFGQSRMSTTAVKPAGIDSGVALREYKDQTTQRFSTQEKAFERFILDVLLVMLWHCKKLGKSAPVILAPSKFGKKKIEWSEVDMGDLKIQLQAASTLSRSPAGRLQTVLEWAQAGVIAQDEARRLLQHPDLDRSVSLYTAALDKVEYDLERIADGDDVQPDPFTNLEMASWRSHMQYELWVTDGAPEDVLERCRVYCSLAEYWRQQGAQSVANANAMNAMGSPDAGQPGAMQPGAMPVAAPNAGTPQSAFNVQATQAVA